MDSNRPLSLTICCDWTNILYCWIIECVRDWIRVYHYSRRLCLESEKPLLGMNGTIRALKIQEHRLVSLVVVRRGGVIC